jgi:hypothetical protein
MTTQAQQTLHFNVSRHGWKDAFVVSFLALVLGAFVAQISTVTEHQLQRSPVATAPASSSAASPG